MQLLSFSLRKTSMFLRCAILVLTSRPCHGFSYENLAKLPTPQTSAIEVVQANLWAFQNHDIRSAYDLVSPTAKADINNDVNVYRHRFTQEQGWICYGHLIEHREAQIVLERKILLSQQDDADDGTTPCRQDHQHHHHQVLVRVVPSSTTTGDDDPSHPERPANTAVAYKEYWWILSRCSESGCFMVDAINPAGTLPLGWSNSFF